MELNYSLLIGVQIRRVHVSNPAFVLMDGIKQVVSVYQFVHKRTERFENISNIMFILSWLKFCLILFF